MSPLAPDEIPVPPKQGLGLHDEATSTTSVQESIQPGEQGSILRLQVRPDDMATEHSQLVAEYDDLDR